MAMPGAAKAEQSLTCPACSRGTGSTRRARCHVLWSTVDRASLAARHVDSNPSSTPVARQRGRHGGRDRGDDKRHLSNVANLVGEGAGGTTGGGASPQRSGRTRGKRRAGRPRQADIVSGNADEAA